MKQHTISVEVGKKEGKSADAELEVMFSWDGMPRGYNKVLQGIESDKPDGPFSGGIRITLKTINYQKADGSPSHSEKWFSLKVKCPGSRPKCTFKIKDVTKFKSAKLL